MKNAQQLTRTMLTWRSTNQSDNSSQTQLCSAIFSILNFTQDLKSPLLLAMIQKIGMIRISKRNLPHWVSAGIDLILILWKFYSKFWMDANIFKLSSKFKISNYNYFLKALKHRFNLQDFYKINILLKRR